MSASPFKETTYFIAQNLLGTPCRNYPLTLKKVHLNIL